MAVGRPSCADSCCGDLWWVAVFVGAATCRETLVWHGSPDNALDHANGMSGHFAGDGIASLYQGATYDWAGGDCRKPCELAGHICTKQPQKRILCV